MTMDKLKGHTYMFSPYQYIEVYSHLDPELNWIVHSRVSEFSKSVVGGKYRIYSLCEVVAKAVADVVAEREEFDVRKLIFKNITDSMFNAYQSYTGDKKGSQYHIADLFLIYAVNAAIVQIRYLRI